MAGNPTGYIKIYRKIFGSDLWTDEEYPFDPRSAWIDLIGLAAWRPRKMKKGYQCIKLERGELLASLRFLGQRWQWGKDRVARFLRYLEGETRIETVSETRFGTVYRIVKYDVYQNVPDSQRDSKRDSGPDKVETGSRQREVREKKLEVRSQDQGNPPDFDLRSAADEEDREPPPRPAWTELAEEMQADYADDVEDVRVDKSGEVFRFFAGLYKDEADARNGNFPVHVREYIGVIGTDRLYPRIAAMRTDLHNDRKWSELGVGEKKRIVQDRLNPLMEAKAEA